MLNAKCLIIEHYGRLDLGRADPVARHVDHVVHAAGDPVVAVLVAAAAVACRHVQDRSGEGAP